MSTRYRAAVDAWLVLVIALAGGASLYACWTVMNAEAVGMWVVIPMAALGIGLPCWILLGTHYTLSAATLDVRCGPVRTQIPLDRIKSVRPVRSFLASSALSVDRLEITYDKFGVIMVSPRERERFIDELERLRARG